MGKILFHVDPHNKDFPLTTCNNIIYALLCSMVEYQSLFALKENDWK